MAIIPADLVPVSFLFGDAEDLWETQVRMCAVDWSLHATSPWMYPMYVHLVRASGCAPDTEDARASADALEAEQRGGERATANRVMTVTLRQLAADERSRASEDRCLLEPSGFIHHESRCGSTLAANVLSAVSNGSAVVYSEAPFGELFGLPEFQALPRSEAVALLRTIVGAYVRASCVPSGSNALSRPRAVFFKTVPQVAQHLELLVEAFRRVPWVYLYRDALEVAMSNFEPVNAGLGPEVPATKHVTFTSTRLSEVPCARVLAPSARGVLEPLVVRQMLAHQIKAEAGSFTPEQYCTAWIAATRQAVIDTTRGVIDRAGNGCESVPRIRSHTGAASGLPASPLGIALVRYDDHFIDALWTTVLPHLIGPSWTGDEAARQRFDEAARQYSKQKRQGTGGPGSPMRPGGGPPPGSGGRRSKQARAWPALRDATEHITAGSASELLALSQQLQALRLHCVETTPLSPLRPPFVVSLSAVVVILGWALWVILRRGPCWRKVATVKQHQ